MVHNIRKFCIAQKKTEQKPWLYSSCSSPFLAFFWTQFQKVLQFPFSESFEGQTRTEIEHRLYLERLRFQRLHPVVASFKNKRIIGVKITRWY